MCQTKNTHTFTTSSLICFGSLLIKSISLVWLSLRIFSSLVLYWSAILGASGPRLVRAGFMYCRSVRKITKLSSEGKVSEWPHSPLVPVYSPICGLTTRLECEGQLHRPGLLSLSLLLTLTVSLSTLPSSTPTHNLFCPTQPILPSR